MVFHRSHSDSNSPYVSKTLPSNLANLSTVVVWLVSTRALISKFSCPFTKPLVTVLSALVTIDLHGTFMFRSFFIPLLRSRYLPPFSLPFSFTLRSTETARFLLFFLSFLFFFFFFWLSRYLVVWPIFDDPFVSQTSREVCVSFFLRWVLDCAYAICSYGNIIIIIMLLLESFTTALADTLSLSFSDKNPQVSWILLSIMADFNHAVVRMVSIRRFISKFWGPFTNPLVTVPRATITIGVNLTFMFHSLFNSQARSKYLSFFSLSFNFICGQPGQRSSQFCNLSFFYYQKVWSAGRY